MSMYSYYFKQKITAIPNEIIPYYFKDIPFNSNRSKIFRKQIHVSLSHCMHLFYQILCMTKMHAWYSVGPNGSLNIALKLYIFGIRYDNSVVRRGPIRTLMYSEAYCVTRDRYSQKCGIFSCQNTTLPY